MHEFLQADPVRYEVNRVLTALEDGIWSPAYESVYLDFKEEAGRRSRDGAVLPSNPRNEQAAYALAGEAACMANTAHGGALIIGVADDGELIGTDLDIPWLRERIYRLTDQLLTVDAYSVHVKGRRLVVLISSQALVPVPWEGRIHWRVKDQCQPVTFEEWDARHSVRLADDWSAQDSEIPSFYVRPEALDIARELLQSTGLQNCINMAGTSDEELLIRLQVVTPRRTLTNAGFLLFIGRTKQSLIYTHATRHTLRTAPRVNKVRTSLLEQLCEVLDAVDRAAQFEIDTENWVGISARALKHALLYHVLVRDWSVTEPSTIKHTPKRALIVAPLTGTTSLETPQENTALARVLRELHLVEESAVHADRAAYYMLKSGMPQPTVKKIAGPYLRFSMRSVPYDPDWSSLIRRMSPRAIRRELEVLQALNFLRDVHGASALALQTELGIDHNQLSLLLDKLDRLTCDGVPVIKQNIRDGEHIWQVNDAVVELMKAASDLRAE